MLLSSYSIRQRCLSDRPMVTPFVDHKVRGGVLSYGLSDAGYDLRLAPGLRFIPASPEPLDPKKGYGMEEL